MFDSKTIPAAIKKSSPDDGILVPAGEYELTEVDKSLRFQAIENGASLRGPMVITGDFVIFTGLKIRGNDDAPAIEIRKGIVIFEECLIEGGVRVCEGGQAYFTVCHIRKAEEGLCITDRSTSELFRTAVSGCHAGVAVRHGSTCALYASRIEQCAAKPGADELGAGIFAEASTVYAEGLSLRGNSVGLYLQDCPEVRLLSTHFSEHHAASIISAGLASSKLHLRSCSFDKQSSARCGQINITGGSLLMEHSLVRPEATIALTANQARLEFFRSRLESASEIAVDAQMSHIEATDLSLQSITGAALSASDCRGVIKLSSFTGQPPTAILRSNDLILEECKLIDSSVTDPDTVEKRAGSAMDALMEALNQTVSHENVRAELERIIRQAHAAYRRGLRGFPMTTQSFHAALIGPKSVGEESAGAMLAQALHVFSIIHSPELHRVTIDQLLEEGIDQLPKEGALFLSAREATGFTTATTAAVRTLIENLTRDPERLVIMEGEREEIRRVLRLSPAIQLAFSNIINFASYGPVELTNLFTQACIRDGITLSSDAALTLLLAFHFYSDRMDRRFTSVEGVLSLYQRARRLYLERCGRLERFDCEMEAQDLDLPMDKLLRNATDRMPAFSSFCPSCSKENPWVHGLDRTMVCVHCEKPYLTKWGLWRESFAYRRLKEAAPRIEGGAISRRAHHSHK
ncbi:hypothetical protein TSACC_21264 [Terrimicrobium sacchariphilum]|uniref:Right handed beta helix region n=2 Tax=Terrimicrobium sacchariphilum TaxID=690879 RepID=A0A146G637_TERSA|nr:hypothetical protein TSACC_21264 [Terrimicrobium sacchariphilum]